MARLGGHARSVLGDIRDEPFIDGLMQELRPHVVFHAAAHKHVPILERFPAEAVRTNVHGTHVLVRAAIRCGTQRFVAISTDKAVRPHCVMGATKRLAEQLVVAGDGPGRHFCAVRFGNVLGSRGSVVPTFLDQLREGGAEALSLHPEVGMGHVAVEIARTADRLDAALIVMGSRCESDLASLALGSAS